MLLLLEIIIPRMGSASPAYVEKESSPIIMSLDISKFM